MCVCACVCPCVCVRERERERERERVVCLCMRACFVCVYTSGGPENLLAFICRLAEVIVSAHECTMQLTAAAKHFCIPSSRGHRQEGTGLGTTSLMSYIEVLAHARDATAVFESRLWAWDIVSDAGGMHTLLCVSHVVGCCSWLEGERKSSACHVYLVLVGVGLGAGGMHTPSNMVVTHVLCCHTIRTIRTLF